MRLYLDPGTAPAKAVADVLIAMSDLHQALGGEALTFTVGTDAVGGAVAIDAAPVVQAATEGQEAQ